MDLDDDELKATRKLLGVDKENSIEESIKRCKELIKPKHSEWIGITNQNAIEIVLGNLEALCDMKRLADRELKNARKINEEHKRENGLLRKKLKELEEENMQKDLEIIGAEEYTKANMKEIIEKYYTANKDCISKQKIKDILNNNYLIFYEGDTEFSDDATKINGVKYIKAEVLEELLQESEDK